MKNIRDFLSEHFQFLEVKLSIYLNRRVFVMPSAQVKKYNVFFGLNSLPIQLSETSQENITGC